MPYPLPRVFDPAYKATAVSHACTASMCFFALQSFTASYISQMTYGKMFVYTMPFWIASFLKSRPTVLKSR